MPWSVRPLLDDEWPTCQPGVGSNSRLGRKHRSMCELVPDRQREAEIHILWTVDPVVDAVEVWADEDSSERTEAQIGVGVGERTDRGVDDEHQCRHRAVGDEHDPRYQCAEIRDVNERMCPENRENAHVLLGMVQLVETPE